MCTPEMSTQAQVIPVSGEIFAWKESAKTVLLWENKEHLFPLIILSPIMSLFFQTMVYHNILN